MKDWNTSKHYYSDTTLKGLFAQNESKMSKIDIGNEYFLNNFNCALRLNDNTQQGKPSLSYFANVIQPQQ